MLRAAEPRKRHRGLTGQSIPTKKSAAKKPAAKKKKPAKHRNAVKNRGCVSPCKAEDWRTHGGKRVSSTGRAGGMEGHPPTRPPPSQCRAGAITNAWVSLKQLFKRIRQGYKAACHRDNETATFSVVRNNKGS
jgi:hypothetical protein